MSGEHHQMMYVEGRVLDTSGAPIANALIDTWEADEDGTAAPHFQCQDLTFTL
jgi:protocatechuate 3,4-dioxygenase beta subunit